MSPSLAVPLVNDKDCSNFRIVKIHNHNYNTLMSQDFDINSLAEFLHITPAEARKMAERGRVPGKRIGGQWKFFREEIHAWFEDRIGISDERELVQVEKVLEIQSRKQIVDSFHIPDMMPVDLVFVPLLARTKPKVIQLLCNSVAATGMLWDPEKMGDAIRKREDLHPTALENGVAMLHPRRPMTNIIGEAFIALGVTTNGIAFGGPRGTLTDVFFLIGSTDEAVHLRVLARLSRLIREPDFLNNLRAKEDAQAAHQCIVEFDEQLD
jgi:PTS system nitrogen regulatory IIA component